MNMYNLFYNLFKHKVKIVATFLLITAVVTIRAFMLEPVYEARATLLVKMWKEDESRLGIGSSDSNLRLTLSQEEMVNTEVQILTGRDLAERVIASTKIEKMYPDIIRQADRESSAMDAAVQAFAENLKVAGIRKSNVIAVSFQHHDPKIAAEAVNKLVEEFKEKHLVLHSDPQSSFIGSQFTSFENKLKGLERDLQTFQQTNNVFSLEEQRSLLLKQRMDLDTSYKIAVNNISELRSKISSIKAQLSYVSNNNSRYTQTDRDRIIIDAKSKLLDLQLKEQELRRKYTTSNRLVINARKEIDLVNQFLKEQEEGIVGKVKTGNPVYQSLETDLFRAEGDLNSQIARADAVKNQVIQLNKEIALLDMSENQMQNLKREIAINEKNYQVYAERQEEARISEAMNKLKLSNISVIQAAAVPVKPIKPDRLFHIGAGALVGIFCGLAFAYISERTGQTFSDPETAERYLALPVLLTIPHKEV